MPTAIHAFSTPLTEHGDAKVINRHVGGAFGSGDCRGMRRVGLSVSDSENARKHPDAAAKSADDIEASVMSRLEALVAAPLQQAQLAGRHRAGR